MKQTVIFKSLKDNWFKFKISEDFFADTYDSLCDKYGFDKDDTVLRDQLINDAVMAIFPYLTKAYISGLNPAVRDDYYMYLDGSIRHVVKGQYEDGDDTEKVIDEDLPLTASQVSVMVNQDENNI